MKRFWGSTLLFLFALLLFAVHPVSAQKITGDLNGTVTDASGAAVPNAKVVAENLGTKAVREASTTETGAYRITELQPGQYKLTVTAQGFKTFTREAQVATGQITTSDFALAVGALSETITVEASTPIIEFNDRLNSYVDKDRIVDLPFTGRDFNSLLGITPGVQRAPGGGFLARSEERRVGKECRL